MSKQPVRHAILEEIAASLNNRLPTTTVTILGHTYTMTVLRPEGEDWAAMRSVGPSISTYATTTMKPRLAAAITAIDGTPIEQLFELPASMERMEREQFASQPMAMRDWRREQLLEFLKESGDNVLIEELFKAYSEMTMSHRKALREGAESFSATSNQASGN